MVIKKRTIILAVLIVLSSKFSGYAHERKYHVDPQPSSETTTEMMEEEKMEKETYEVDKPKTEVHTDMENMDKPTTEAFISNGQMPKGLGESVLAMIFLTPITLYGLKFKS